MRKATNPRHIAMVTETFPPEVNGVAMTLSHLVTGLRDAGHRVTLVRPKQQKYDYGSDNEFIVQGLPIPIYAGLKLGLPVTRRLYKHWSHSRPDVVHVATEGPLGWSALEAAKRLGIPATSSFHTNYDRYSSFYHMGWLRDTVLRYLINFHARTCTTMVPTREMAEKLSAEGLHDICVVGRGVDTSLFNPQRRSQPLREEWGVLEDGLAVLYVGRLAAEKNLGLVERSFAAIQTHFPQARLVLVGDGPMYDKLAGIKHDYILAGKRHGEDLATYYASGDLFLFPSTTETFGNVTQEAMASALPVVAFNYAAAAELIRSGENGITVAFADEQEFIDAAVMLAQNREHRLELGSTARTTALNRDWSKIVEEFEHIISNVIRDNGARCHLNNVLGLETIPEGHKGENPMRSGVYRE